MTIIFWDYDGTLIDSEVIYKQAFLDYSKKNNILLKNITIEYFSKNMSGKYPKDFIKILKSDGYIREDIENNKLCEDLTKVYAEAFDNLKLGTIKIIPEIDKVVDFLSKQKNIKMCITSSSKIKEFNLKHKNVNNKILQDNFIFEKNVFLCEKEKCNPKPEPDIFEKALQNMEYNNDKLIIIEDSATGCKAGKNFKDKYKNLDVIVIGYNMNNTNILKENGADITFNNVNDLIEYFKKEVL